MGLLFYSDTVIFRKYKPPLSCSVLQSDNYMIIGACVRNITDGVTLAYSERINSADPVRHFLQGLFHYPAKKSQQNVPSF